MRNSDTADPFDTEQIRARVLDAWRASPVRFREDANTEEDFALGGYRDRLIIELLQNAADAANAAGVPGRVRIELLPDRLVVANSGRPLDAAGVASLAAMRASAKRDDTTSVGRFGVGFAAVLSVSDEPRVLSTTGGVHFSAARTAGEVLSDVDLMDEVDRRHGHVPVLRLPYFDDEPPPDDYDTAVVLRFREDAARAVAADLVNAVDGTMLLALPALNEIVVVDSDGETRRMLAERHENLTAISDAGAITEWRTATVGGQLPDLLLADRPTEERRRTSWAISWAVPVGDDGRPVALPSGVERVVHAPTPTAELLEFPALLFGTFPLDSSRRHVEPAAVTGFLVRQAAQAYAQIVAETAADAGSGALALVPRPTLGGLLDTELRRGVIDALVEISWVPLAAGKGTVAPGRAVVLDPSTPELVAVLAEVVDGLVPPDWARAGVLTESLGATLLPLSEIVEQLATITREPGWWRQLYDALMSVDSQLLDGLPVPLVDGRVVKGVRSCVLPESGTSSLAALGLRVIHPDAAHPLLLRLGARSGEARAVLADPELHGRLREMADLPDREDFARAVLTLVAEAGVQPGEEPALSELLIPTADGSWFKASDIVLPGSPLAEVAASDVPIANASFVGEVGELSLVAVGALAQLSVTRHHDVLTDADTMGDLIVDGELWVEHVASLRDVPDLDGAIVSELLLVNGLDLVRDDAWDQTWSMLTEAGVRRAITEPVAVVLGNGERLLAPSIAGWWLSDVPLFGALTPRQCCLAGDSRLIGVYEPVLPPAGADEDLLTAVGVAASVEQIVNRPGGADDLLERLVDEDAAPTATGLRGIYQALAELDESHWPNPPEQLRVADADRTRVVDAKSVTVVVAPHHRVLVDGWAVAGSLMLADILDVSTSDTAAARLTLDGGVVRELPESVAALVTSAPRHYVEHDELAVAGEAVEWWVDSDGAIHAATVAGLARGVAWSSGQWGRRWEFAAVLADDQGVASDWFERTFDQLS